MEILGVKIDNISFEEAVRKAGDFLDDNKQHYIVTVNPEIVIISQKDREFQKILERADLAIADGVGLIWASRWFGQPLKERLTGVDLMEEICWKAAQRHWPIFLLGAGPGVAEKAAANLKEKCPGLDIRGGQEFFNGQAKILFVAFGAPKQEKWINDNLKKYPAVKLAMGVGGAFDFVSGGVRRAPKFLRKAGLEWFWRLIIQPWRIKRIFKATVVFPWLVVRK